MTSDLLDLGIEQLTEQFASGNATPVDALDAALAQAEHVEPVINALAFTDPVGARAAAAAAAERWRLGRPRGPLDGVPVTVKDSVAVVGMPRHHGTAANAGLPVSDADAPPAARLKEAGAVIFAKTAMPDFGMLASGVSSLYGIVRNPWDPRRSPGGSSAGGGASLAAGVGWASVGSDIAGSVRLPAAQCGLAGLKPTQGRIPHLSPSTVRSAGPMARSVADMRLAFDVVSGADPRDHLSLEPPTAHRAGRAGIEGLRIGVLTDMGYGLPADAETIAAVAGAAETLAAAGAVIDSVPPPFSGDPYAPLDRLFQVRALAEWESFSEAARERVLPQIVDWCAPARTYSAVDYERDLGDVQRSAMAVTEHLAPYDIVLSPVLPSAAFPAESVGMDPDVPLRHTSFTCWYNQTGQPAASVGFGRSESTPIGVQVVGRRFADELVVDVAEHIEARRPVAPPWPRSPRAAETGGTQRRGTEEV